MGLIGGFLKCRYLGIDVCGVVWGNGINFYYLGFYILVL